MTEEFETRSSLKQEKSYHKQLVTWNVIIAVLLCITVVSAVFITKTVINDLSNDDKTFSGSRDSMSDEQIQEVDEYYIEQLKKLAVNVNKIDYNSQESIDEVLKKIDESKLELPDKVNATSGFAGLVSNYFVENNQSKIREYVETLKNLVDEKELDKNYEADFYLLNLAFQSSVVDYSIPPNEKDENLSNVDEFIFDLRRIAVDLYIEDEKWDNDKTQERLENLSESSRIVDVPEISTTD